MSACEAVLGSAVGTSWWLEPGIASLTFLGAMRFFRDHEPSPRAWSRPPYTFTIKGLQALGAYWVFVTAWVSVVPPRPNIASGCPRDAAGLAHLLVELAAGVLAYDFVFFWVHLLMHRSPAAYRLLCHGRHHEFEAAGGLKESSYRTVNHSLVDGGLQVVCNILCQRTTPWGATKSRLARWLHNIVVVSMLCESHTSAAEPRVARRLFGGVRDHYLHHRHRGPPFQQFFSYLDALVPHFDAALDALRGSGAAAKPAEAAAEARYPPLLSAGEPKAHVEISRKYGVRFRCVAGSCRVARKKGCDTRAYGALFAVESVGGATSEHGVEMGDGGALEAWRKTDLACKFVRHHRYTVEDWS